MQSCSEIYDDCSIKGLASNTTCRIFGNYYTDCRQDGPNPYYDNMSFDNIAMAWIFIYQVSCRTAALSQHSYVKEIR